MSSFSSFPWKEFPGLNWSRVRLLGHGTYGVVYLSLLTDFKNVNLFLAVKTAHLNSSASLVKETRILDEFRDCPEIISSYGHIETLERGSELYNIVLEYAPFGTLSDLIRRSDGCALRETSVRVYTRMILNGLRCLHIKGYVHCDLKPDNILVFPCNSQDGCCRLKLADFGLSKEPDEDDGRVSERYKYRFRGTPLYTSPESVAIGEIGPAMDIWSLGCIVIEMITGRHPWYWYGLDVSRFGTDVAYFLAFTRDWSPRIPQDMTEMGKDFLRMCFIRDPRQRWTADLLLHHPFLSEVSSGLSESRRVLIPTEHHRLAQNIVARTLPRRFFH